MTISYVWPRVEKQNDGFNENQQIEAVTGQLFANLFKARSSKWTPVTLGTASETLVGTIHIQKYLFSSVKEYRIFHDMQCQIQSIIEYLIKARKLPLH